MVPVQALGVYGEALFELNQRGGAWTKSASGAATPVAIRVGWDAGDFVARPSRQTPNQRTMRTALVEFRGVDAPVNIDGSFQSETLKAMHAMYGFALNAARAKKFARALLAYLRGVVPVDATGRPLHTCPKCWNFGQVVACGQAGSLVLELVGRRGAEMRQGKKGDGSQGDSDFRQILAEGDSFFTVVSFVQYGNQLSDAAEAVLGWKNNGNAKTRLFHLNHRHGTNQNKAEAKFAFFLKMVAKTHAHSSFCSVALDSYKSLVLKLDCSSSPVQPPSIPLWMSALFDSPDNVGAQYSHQTRFARVIGGHGPRSTLCILRTLAVLHIAQLLRLPHMCVLLSHPEECGGRPASYFTKLQASEFFSRFVSVYVPGDANVAGFGDVPSGFVPEDVLQDMLAHLVCEDCVLVEDSKRVPLISLVAQNQFAELQDLCALVVREGFVDKFLIAEVEARGRCDAEVAKVQDGWARAKVPSWAVDDVLGLHAVKSFCDSELAAGTVATARLRTKNLNPAAIAFVKVLTDGYSAVFIEFCGKGKTDASRDALVLVLGRIYALGSWMRRPAPCAEPRHLVDFPALAYPSHAQLPRSQSRLSAEVLLQFAECFCSLSCLDSIRSPPHESSASGNAASGSALNQHPLSSPAGEARGTLRKTLVTGVPQEQSPAKKLRLVKNLKTFDPSQPGEGAASSRGQGNSRRLLRSAGPADIAMQRPLLAPVPLSSPAPRLLTQAQPPASAPDPLSGQRTTAEASGAPAAESLSGQQPVLPGSRTTAMPPAAVAPAPGNQLPEEAVGAGGEFEQSQISLSHPVAVLPGARDKADSLERKRYVALHTPTLRENAGAESLLDLSRASQIPPKPSFPEPGSARFAKREKPRPVECIADDKAAARKYAPGKTGRYASRERDLDSLVALNPLRVPADILRVLCVVLFKFDATLKNLVPVDGWRRQSDGDAGPTHFEDIGIYLDYRTGHVVSEILASFRNRLSALGINFRGSTLEGSFREWPRRLRGRCMTEVVLNSFATEQFAPPPLSLPDTENKTLLRMVLSLDVSHECRENTKGCEILNACWCLQHAKEGDFLLLHLLPIRQTGFVSSAVSGGMAYVKDVNLHTKRGFVTLVVLAALRKTDTQSMFLARTAQEDEPFKVAATHMVSGIDFQASMKTLCQIHEIAMERSVQPSVNPALSFIQTPQSRSTMRQTLRSLREKQNKGTLPSAVDVMRPYLEDCIEKYGLRVTGEQQRVPVLLATAAVSLNLLNGTRPAPIRTIVNGPPGSSKTNIPTALALTLREYWCTKRLNSLMQLRDLSPLTFGIMPTNLASCIVVERLNETGSVTVCALFSSKGVADGDESDDARILRLASREVIATADETDLPGGWQKIGFPDARPSMMESSYRKLRQKRFGALKKIADATEEWEEVKMDYEDRRNDTSKGKLRPRGVAYHENRISRALADLKNSKMKLARLHSQLADMVPEVADVVIGTPHAFWSRRHLPKGYSRKPDMFIYDEMSKIEEPKAEMVLASGFWTANLVEVQLGDEHQLEPYVDKNATALEMYEKRGVMSRQLANVAEPGCEAEGLKGAPSVDLLPLVFRSPRRTTEVTSYSAYGGQLVSGHLETSLATVSPLQNTPFGCLALINTAGDNNCSGLLEIGGTSSVNYGVVDLTLEIMKYVVSKFPDLCLKNRCKENADVARFIIISTHAATTREMKRAISKVEAFEHLDCLVGNIDNFQGASTDFVITLLAKSGQPKAGENVSFSKSNNRGNVGTSRSEKVQIVVGDFDYYGSIGSEFWNLYVSACLSRFSYWPWDGLAFLKQVNMDFEVRC